MLKIIEQPKRQKTLKAWREERGGVPAYVLDIRLQCEGETVFFEL